MPLDHARTMYSTFAVTPASEAVALQAAYHPSGLKAFFVSGQPGDASR